jgi:hypothetical protein
MKLAAWQWPNRLSHLGSDQQDITSHEVSL